MDTYVCLCFGRMYWFGMFLHSLNPLQNDKILDQSKFKADADRKINVIQNLNFILGKVENILGKGENAGYRHFLLFPKCFLKASFSRVAKSWDCMGKG